ncbi:MAG TPA: hypothetical protein VLE02_01210 [Nitrosarchaeum sp.]|nr:hypothetical protein [Nitrosarchaeum sp.]
MENIILCYMLRCLTEEHVDYVEKSYTKQMRASVQELGDRMQKEIKPVRTNKINDEYWRYMKSRTKSKSIISTTTLCMMNFIAHGRLLVAFTKTSVFFQFLVSAIYSYIYEGVPNKFLRTEYLDDIKKKIETDRVISEVCVANIFPLVLEYVPIRCAFKLRLVSKACTYDSYNYICKTILQARRISRIKPNSFFANQIKKHDDFLNVAVKRKNQFLHLNKLNLLNNVKEIILDHVFNEECLKEVVSCSNLLRVKLDLSRCELEDWTTKRGINKKPRIRLSDISNICASTLDITACNITDLSPLQGSIIHTLVINRNRKLEDLSIFAHQCENMDTCEEVTRVCNLLASYTVIRDISPLSLNTHITTLILNYTFVSDLSPLKNNKTIKYLSVVHTYINDIYDLKDTNLEYLNVSETNVCILTEIKTLKILVARCCKIDTIYGFESAHTVDLKYSSFRDVTRLFHACGNYQYCKRKPCNTIIQRFSCRQEDAKDECGMFFLEGTSVRDLRIENVYAQNIVFLAQNKYLKKLRIAGSKIKDISWLRGNTSLEELNLKGSGVFEVCGIEDTAIKTLNISLTKVKNISPVLYSQVQVLNIRNNRVRDLSALADIQRVIVVLCDRFIESTSNNIVVKPTVCEILCDYPYCDHHSVELYGGDPTNWYCEKHLSLVEGR